MDLKKEVENTITNYTKERLLMNIKEFDLLLKRVNIEDDTDIKRKMLSVIEQYLGALPTGDVVVGELAKVEEAPKKVEEETIAEITETPEVEAINEEVAEEVTQEADSQENWKMNQQNAAVEIAKQHEEAVSVVEEPATLVEEVTETAEEEVIEEKVIDEAPAVEETAPVVEDTVEEIASVVEEVVEEKAPVTEEAITTETEEYVESFGLISTTKDEHLTKVIEKGGVLFRDKRSFMLGLLLEDELLALAKTTKIDEFPEDIRNHMKKNGFVSVDVVSIGDVKKKSRARYVDVTFRNFTALAEDHWIVQNVNNLLDHGIAPEGKEEVKQEEVKQEEAPVQAELNLEATAAAPAELPHLVSTFIVNPSFVETFKTKKEQVLAQPYGITSDGTVAKLFANNGNNTIILAANPKTTIKEGTFSVKIVDYTMTEENGQTTAQFTFDVAVKEEAKEEKAEQPAPAPQKANVPLKPLAEVPADFPLVNNLKIKLHPTAGMMFNADSTKKMIGKPVNLAFKTSENGESTVALIHDVFEMGVSANTLTNGNIRDSKWVARVTGMDLIEEGNVKVLNVQFDALSELEVFLHETKEEALDVQAYVAITEESYGKRQQEIAEKRAAAQASVEQPKEEQSAPKVEELMNKEYNPESAKKLIDPKADADYSKGYQELVQSQSKDIGGAMQNIQNKTAMTPKDRQEVMQKANNLINGVINQTLNETGIHTKTEEKATGTTQVVGNLQEGAGNLTETETVINFITPYPPQSWQQSVGKQIELISELAIGNGPISGKRVSMIGKNGQPVAQGQVDMSVALLADGNQHTAELISIEGATQLEKGYSVALRLGSFKKMALA